LFLLSFLIPSARQQHTLTLEHVDKQTSVDAHSAESVVAAGWRTDNSDGTSETEKQRLSWQGRWDVNQAMADQIQVTVAHQQAQAIDRSVEDRTRTSVVGAPVPPVGSRQQRIRDITYTEQFWQAVIRPYQAPLMLSAPLGAACPSPSRPTFETMEHQTT